MEQLHTLCKKEGEIFVACVQKRKFAPPCIDLIIAWDKCMMEKQKLMEVQTRLKSNKQPK